MSAQDRFSLFGPDHLAALVAVGITAAVCIVVARLGGTRCGRGIRWLVAATLAAAHATESLVAWWQGWYARDMLPLQLCDVAAMLAVWGLLTRDRRAIEPLYFFALSGTLPALLTPELDVTFPQLRFVVYFVEHGLTVAAPLLLVAGLGLHPRPGSWRRAVVLVNALAAVAILANLALGTNFLYLSRKPVGPTPFDLFGPWPHYLLVLEVLVLVVFRLLQGVADATRGRSPGACTSPGRTLCRTTIHSCDYAASMYTYAEVPGDAKLEHSLDRGLDRVEPAARPRGWVAPRRRPNGIVTMVL